MIPTPTPEPGLFTSASLNTLYLIFLAVMAAIPTLNTLYGEYRKTKVAKNKEPGDLLTQAMAISHSAAEEVLTKSTRIYKLEEAQAKDRETISSLKDSIDVLETNKRHVEEELITVKARVAALETDKKRLQDENALQMARIAALEEEKRQQQETIDRLTARVTQLEKQVVSLGGTPEPYNGDDRRHE